MTRLTVTKGGSSTSPAIWVDWTPWCMSTISTHVTVPGGLGLGKTFARGADNAVCTLRGRIPMTSAGRTMVDSLASGQLTVADGIETRTGQITGITMQETAGGAWMVVQVTLMEV